MAHISHPHGERVVQIHKLHDHIEHQQPGGAKKSVAKLPDAKREDPKAHPYPESFNPTHSEVEES